MATKVLTNLRRLLGKRRQDKRTTLNPNYLCGVCAEPAMVYDGPLLRCPTCWLREKGKQIKPLDRGGYYP